MLTTKVMSKKQTILGIERYLTSWILLHPKKRGKYIPAMNNNFPEVLSPCLRYYHAQNQGYVKKIDNSKH